MYSLDECSVPGCSNKKLAKGLCNGHYLRKLKGKDLSSPVIPRRVKCSLCDKPHYGKGYCQAHYNYHLRKSRWLELIEYKGGKCQLCFGKFPYYVYDFHHRNPKEKDLTIGSEITNLSMKAIKQEVDKCDLLCANCHREVHYARSYVE